MHPYSIQSARWKVVGVMMLAAVGSTSVLQGVFEQFSTVAPSHLTGLLGTPGVPTFTIFTSIYLLFDRRAWQWPLVRRFVAQPNLNGSWKGTLESSFANEDTNQAPETVKSDEGDERFPQIAITQTWSHIELLLETEKSISSSTSTTFRTNKSFPELVLTYVNKPKSEPATELNMHEGTNVLRVATDADGQLTLEGTYYTDEQRNNHGKMSFERISEENNLFIQDN